MTAVLYALATWFAGDLLHALWLWCGNRCWERTVTRDADGILANAAAFTLQGSTRTAILFVHGFADTPEVWQLIAPRVHAQTRATCRALRLPDVGAPLRAQRNTRLDTWLNAIHDAVAELRLCHDNVFLAGHSLGGGLVLLAARDNPALADGVIVFAPLIRVARARSPLASPEHLFAFVNRAFLFSRAFQNPFPAIINTKDGRQFPYARDRFIAFAVYRALFEMTRRLAAVAEPDLCHAPVLAFLSSRDRVIDSAAAERHLSRARIVTTAAAGHVLPLDVGWEARADEMAEFVGKC